MSWTSVAPGYCSASSILICQIMKEYTKRLNSRTRYLQVSLKQLRLIMCRSVVFAGDLVR